MDNKIKCPNCGKVIEISEALKHDIEESVIKSIEEQHKNDLENLRLKTLREITDKKEKEIEDEKERNRELTKKLGELLDETRLLKRKDEDREIEMKKRLMEEEENIRLETRKKSEEEHKLKDFEKEKKLSDALKQVEELKKKIEQGSQQTQGESLESEIEEKLANEFPGDIISEVKKGQRGADVAQTVIDRIGRKCGIILWESKNAKWTDGWITKLKEDQRQSKADLAVLVSVNLPPDISSFKYYKGIWICSWKSFLALATSLRFTLVSLHHERQSAVGADEKMKTLYQYLTGNEFKMRVEGIVEAFTTLQDEVEREKRWFNVKWARQEKEIRKVIDHTHGMYGDLQGVIGKSLPEIKTLQITDGE